MGAFRSNQRTFIGLVCGFTQRVARPDRHGVRAVKERVIAETAAHLELWRSSRGRSADGEEERGERVEGGRGVTGAAQKVGGERDGPPHFGGRCSICRWL